MCANYRPVTRSDRMLAFFGVERARDELPHDIFPLGLAPYIRLAGASFDRDGRTVEDGIFGLLPPFASELAFGRRTYNARSETVARLASFKAAWAAGRRCIIPAESIYEPNWETGQAVRWRIAQPGDVPFGIAGIYESWRHPDGREMSSFAMLTLNADGHPLMSRLHRPGEEKRMVVVLHPDDHAEWLTCPVVEAPRFFRLWNGPLDAAPDALPSRAPRASSIRTVAPKRGGPLPSNRPPAAGDPTPDLFD